MTIDPVDQSVIGQGIVAAAHEMGAKLVRSAYSTILREARDGSAALLDRDGNMIAQAELIPMQLGSIGATFKPCANIHPPDELGEGDFYIINDPYSGGQHLPDVFIYCPIFFEQRLIGFSASVAHHVDLGGGAPGLNLDARDVHQEGIVFPPSCYNIHRDWNGGTLERFLRANVRLPKLTIGDFNAQFAANAVGAKRLQELCGRYQVETVLAAMRGLLDYSERRMRKAIAALPDGRYEGEECLDGDGVDGEPIKVKAVVTIKGDEVAVDFTGTDAQVRTPFNAPFASTCSAALAAVKAVASSPDIPFNEGVVRPITVTAPYGSLLNPKPPSPVRARMNSSYRAFGAVMKALTVAAPERVIAPGFDTTHTVCLSSFDDNAYRIYLEIFGGGYGAGPGVDGCDGVDAPLSNCSNIPIEALDLEYSFFRVTEYSLRENSAGRGQWRGGLGLRRRYKILSDDVSLAHYSDRYQIAPQGALGGAPGVRARTTIVRSDGTREALSSKAMATLRAGDELLSETGGGAGYGFPAERAPADTKRDIAAGLVARLNEKDGV